MNGGRYWIRKEHKLFTGTAPAYPNSNGLAYDRNSGYKDKFGNEIFEHDFLLSEENNEIFIVYCRDIYGSTLWTITICWYVGCMRNGRICELPIENVELDKVGIMNRQYHWAAKSLWVKNHSEFVRKIIERAI